MTSPLRVLLVEDSADDQELLSIQLGRMGFEANILRVENAASFAAALADGAWDVVIADHSLPSFDAAHALRLLQAAEIDVPFVVMSGTIDVGFAITLMKAGAHDFVTKDEPARLEPVLRRELGEATNRRARREADAARERLVVELEAANRYKDEFLAMLGHELRNPLAPMVTALAILRQRDQGVSNREHEIIERQTSHMLRLVEDLLDVQRIAHGKVALRRLPCELAVLVTQAIELAMPILEERRHRVTIDVAPAGLVADVDQVRLVQVISNLLTNAARYTPPGGHIAVAGAREDDEIVLKVTDSGIGIEPVMLPALFDIFVQGARACDRKPGGLGIGLAIVRNLIALHGGTVTAASSGHGLGSEFTVRLPCATSRTDATPSADPPADDAVPRSVLIVDDNVDAAEMLADLVRLDGHEVEVAFDGPSALALLQTFAPTMIVLDIGLPAMDGFEVARRIRALPAHARTLIVAVTGYGLAADRDRARDAGFDLHLVKPVDHARLMHVIARHDVHAGGAISIDA